MAAPAEAVERCKRKLVALQHWFGEPRLRWKGEIIDGRTRTAAWEALEFPATPPTYTAPTVRHAARALFYAHHVDRIARLFPELQLRDADIAASVLMVPREETRHVLLAYGARSAVDGRSSPRRNRVLPMRRLRRMVMIVRRAQEEGRKTLDLAELERLLAPWL